MRRKNKAAQMLGRKGAKSRWAKTTPEQRSEIARKMVQAREAKRQLRKSGSAA